MKKHRMPDIKEGGVNVTPLIDIVMCLIVFFMLVAKIGVNPGIDKGIELPASILGRELKSVSSTLTLNVRQGPGNVPQITANVEGGSGQLVEVSITKLKDVLRRLRYGPDGKLGTRDDLPDFAVNIRGQTDMQYYYLEPVLIACAESSIKNINFNTRSGSADEKSAPAEAD